MRMDETHTIWIEKYRPARLADIVGQDDIVERLSSYVKSGNLPHLLFTGSAAWEKRQLRSRSLGSFSALPGR